MLKPVVYTVISDGQLLDVEKLGVLYKWFGEGGRNMAEHGTLAPKMAPPIATVYVMGEGTKDCNFPRK
jgi:hypothetical protein